MNLCELTVWYQGETGEVARLSDLDFVVMGALCRAHRSLSRWSSPSLGSVEDQAAVVVVSFEDQFANVSCGDAHLHVHRHGTLEGFK